MLTSSCYEYVPSVPELFRLSPSYSVPELFPVPELFSGYRRPRVIVRLWINVRIAGQSARLCLYRCYMVRSADDKKREEHGGTSRTPKRNTFRLSPSYPPSYLADLGLPVCPAMPAFSILKSLVFHNIHLSICEYS